MSRKTVRRKAVSEAVSWHQDQALSSTLFILKEFGPTGFLLKEDGEHKNFKVCLGDPHTCTCAAFQKEKDLCKHICWILMRKFRLPRDHEYCFQPGLVDRQISEVLQGLYRTRTPRPADGTPSGPPGPGPCGEDGSVRQKAIEEDDVCPICQDELMKKRFPVTYCRFGCGNNVHISCMKKLADYQIGSETELMVKCPLCREDFCELKLLLQLVKTAGKLYTSSEKERLDKHLGILCNNCRICPIVGKCFKCTVCSFFHLCEECYERSLHRQHSLAVRVKRNQQWLPVEQSVDHQPNKALNVNGPSAPSHSMNEFSTKASGTPELVPEHVLKSLPVIRIHKKSNLLEMGMQCRFCLQSFCVSQQVTTLPCRHKFHSSCIKTWLRQSVCCPLDWYSIYNPLTLSRERETWNNAGVQAPVTATDCSRTTLTDQQRSELFIPGLSLMDRIVRAPGQQSTDRSEVSTAEPLDPLSIDSLPERAQDLRITSTGLRTNSSEDQCREHSRSRQRCSSLGRVLSVSDLQRRLGMKTFLHPRPTCTTRRPKGSSLFPELNQDVSGTQPRLGGLHVHVRRLRLQDGKTRSPRSKDP